MAGLDNVCWLPDALAYSGCFPFWISFAWTFLSLVGWSMSAAALFPAYNEYRDTCGEIADAVGKTRLLKLLISLLKNSRRLFWTHVCFFWFHTLFSCAGIYSLLIPPADSSYAEIRSVILTLLLIGVKPFSLTMQILLYLMTLEQRHSRKELNHSEPHS